MGGWLTAAPFVLDHNATSNTDPIYWNDIIVGATVLILALISMINMASVHAATTQSESDRPPAKWSPD